jgi:hypothetical protein
VGRRITDCCELLLILFDFPSSGNSNQLKLQHPERHVLTGHGDMCDLQQWPAIDPIEQLNIRLFEAIGIGM